MSKPTFRVLSVELLESRQLLNATFRLVPSIVLPPRLEASAFVGCPRSPVTTAEAFERGVGRVTGPQDFAQHFSALQPDHTGNPCFGPQLNVRQPQASPAHVSANAGPD